MKITLKIVALVAILGLTGNVFAQTTADQHDATVGFHAAMPIALDPFNNVPDNTYIDFGTLIPINATLASTAVVDALMAPPAAYAPANITNAKQLMSATAPCRSSRWQVAGEPLATFTLSLNGGINSPISLGNGATVSGLNWMQSGGPQFDGYSVVATFPAAGGFDFAIGGTLNLPIGYAQTGDKSATFAVRAEY